MGIPYDVLLKWSKPNKSDNSKITYEKLKNVIVQNYSYNCDIFLQGSYSNTTHVKENSDIDIVVVNKNINVYSDMNRTTGNISALQNYKSQLYNSINWCQNFHFTLGGKTIKYAGNINYVPADIVPCGVYYSKVNNCEGTILYDNILNKYFINYPKQHSDNGEKKAD